MIKRPRLCQEVEPGKHRPHPPEPKTCPRRPGWPLGSCAGLGVSPPLALEQILQPRPWSLEGFSILIRLRGHVEPLLIPEHRSPTVTVQGPGCPWDSGKSRRAERRGHVAWEAGTFPWDHRTRSPAAPNHLPLADHPGPAVPLNCPVAPNPTPMPWKCQLHTFLPTRRRTSWTCSLVCAKKCRNEACSRVPRGRVSLQQTYVSAVSGWAWSIIEGSRRELTCAHRTPEGSRAGAHVLHGITPSRKPPPRLFGWNMVLPLSCVCCECPSLASARK